MPNQLYNEMNARKAQNGGLENNFFGFMQQMRGQNPRQLIDQMVQSGQLTQQQLNVVQQKANEIGDVFGQFKSRFGF